MGVLGGSFNPPHLGHLAVAEHARTQLGLDLVALVPVHTPPHKPQDKDAASPEQRLCMCRLALAGHERLRACPLEVERGGPSYTIDTLRALHARHPDTSFTLILGSDMARTLPSWRQPSELLALCDLAVAQRPGDGREDVLAALAPVGVQPASVRFLEMPPIDISSSAVRERVAASGAGVKELVGPAVAGYIAEQELYGLAAR